MTDTAPSPSRAAGLRVTTADEVADCIAHALRWSGRKRTTQADDMMARITAGHLLRALEMSGFVLLRKPPTPLAPSTWVPPSKSEE